jgi:flagellar basal-body rod protein FlgB
MALDQIPLFSLLKSRLSYVSQRERLIGQNVANSDTPGFTPKDLKPFALPAGVTGTDGPQVLAPATTSPGHMSLGGQAGEASTSTYASADAPDSDATLNGNRVVLEDQMMKMTEARLDYDTALGIYQKSLNLLRTAARAPGK